MVLGKLPVPGRPTIWIIVGQGPTALAVGAGGGCLDIFTLIYPFSPLSPSLWETARYRLKYCLKGPLNPKQPTNQLLTKLSSPGLFSIRLLGGSRWGNSFNNRHRDLITYFSIYGAKTIIDLYSANITKNLRITYIPFCYLKSLKMKQKQNDIVYGNRY